MSQSIDLSAVTDATFNGSAVEQINLNGAGVWTKPASSPTVWYTSVLPNVDVWNAQQISVNSSPYAEINNGQYVSFVASGLIRGGIAIAGRRSDMILFKENDEIYLAYTVEGDSNYIYPNLNGVDGSNLVGQNSLPHKAIVTLPAGSMYGNCPIYSQSPITIVVGRVDSNLNIVDRVSNGTYAGTTAFNINYGWSVSSMTTTINWSGDNVTISSSGGWSHTTNVNNFATGVTESPLYINVDSVSTSRTVGDKRVFRYDRVGSSSNVASATGPVGDLMYIQKG